MRIDESYDQSKINPSRMDRLVKSLAALRARRDLLLYGWDFVQYREANIKRALGDFRDSSRIYSMLADEIGVEVGGSGAKVRQAFREASVIYLLKYYRGEGKGKIRCVNSVKMIVEEGGPFAASAALVLADDAFGNGSPLEMVERLYSAAIALGSSKEVVQLGATYIFPGNLLKVVTADGGMKLIGQWGQARWFDETPNVLYAPPWCMWYNDFVVLKSIEGRMATRYLMGNLSGALEDLEKASLLDEEDQKLIERGMPSNYMRLMDGLRQGHFFCSKEEIAAFKGSRLRVFVKAEIAMECEHWLEAKKVYETLLLDPERPATVAERAYLIYAIACCNAYAGDPIRAKVALVPFFEKNSELRSTSTYWRAIFALAGISSPEDAILILSKAVQDNPPTEAMENIVMNLGQLNFGINKNAEAKKYFTLIANGEGPEWRVEAARNYLERIAQQELGQAK